MSVGAAPPPDLVQGYTKAPKRILLAHGCRYVRAGKGGHEIWTCPGAKRPIAVDGKIMSRTVANEVLNKLASSRRSAEKPSSCRASAQSTRPAAIL
jgi:hypothetical protein